MKPKYLLNFKNTDSAAVWLRCDDPLTTVMMMIMSWTLRCAAEWNYLLVCRGDFLLQLVQEGLNGWHVPVQVSNLWERQGVLEADQEQKTTALRHTNSFCKTESKEAFHLIPIPVRLHESNERTVFRRQMTLPFNKIDALRSYGLIWVSIGSPPVVCTLVLQPPFSFSRLTCSLAVSHQRVLTGLPNDVVCLRWFPLLV